MVSFLRDIFKGLITLNHLVLVLFDLVPFSYFLLRCRMHICGV